MRARLLHSAFVASTGMLFSGAGLYFFHFEFNPFICLVLFGWGCFLIVSGIGIFCGEDKVVRAYFSNGSMKKIDRWLSGNIRRKTRTKDNRRNQKQT